MTIATPPPRLHEFRELFGEEDPVVFILAPSAERPIPAGDTRRHTVYLFRAPAPAQVFAQWLAGRHKVRSVPVAVRLRALTQALAARDLIYLVDPQPRFGYGSPISFRAALPGQAPDPGAGSTSE
jgi:hypothetical protein